MKKMTLLPLVMLLLAACGVTPPSSSASSISSSSSSSTPSSSSDGTSSPSSTITTSSSSEDPAPAITTIQNARLLAEGSDVTIQGVVTRVTRQRNFYVQQGDYGITIFGYEGSQEVVVGNFVQIYGFIGSFNGLVQLSGAPGSGLPEVTFLTGTSPVITPLTLTEETYDNLTLAANNDGRLVRIRGLRLKNAWVPLLTDSGYPVAGGVNIDMTLGSKTILARFDRYINVADRASLNTFFGGLTANSKFDYEGILGDYNGIQLAVSVATDFTLNDEPAVLPSSLSVSTAVSPAEVVANLTLNLVATVLPSNADDKSVTWSSANTDIATVSNMGVVTGVAVGTVIITATSVAAPLVSGTISIQVLPAPLTLTAIDLAVTRTALKVGASEAITATYLPNGYVGAGISFVSSDAAIATVTSTGVIQARAAGTVTITGTATEDTTKTDSVEVTISAADLIPAVKTALVDTQVSANGIITKIMASNELYFQVGEDAMHVLGPSATFSTVGFSEGDFVQVSGPVKNANAPRRIGTGSGVTVLMTKIDFLPVPTVTPLVITEATYNTTDLPAASSQWRIVQINGLFPPQPWVDVTTASSTNRLFKLGSTNVDVRISNFINSAELLGLNTLFSDFWKNDRVNYNGVLSYFSNNLQLLTAGAKDFTLVEADPVPVNSVTISNVDNISTLASNGQLQLIATISPSNADDLSVNWTSSNDLVATVNNSGLVSGVSAGTVTITATSVLGSIVGSLELTVTQALVLTAIVLSAETQDVAISGTLLLTLTPTPSNFVGTYNFVSSDPLKATVNSAGLVSGVSLGEVTITATSVETPTVSNSITLNVVSLSTVYSTGFESAEGFTAGTTYNNTNEVFRGPANQQWGYYYGTPSTTSPLTDLQSAQMRFYTTATTALGYTFTNFDVADVSYVTFEASAQAASLSVIVSISKDGGITWTDSETIALTTTKNNYRYNVPSEKVAGNTRFKFQLTVSNTGVANRLYLDTVVMTKIER